MIVTNTPLAMFLRKGTTTEPYMFIIEENRRISDGGTIVLQEFPINQVGYVSTNNVVSETPDPVAVEVFFELDDGFGTINEVQFAEIVDPEATLGEEEFRVDYEFGLIHFNPLLYGTSEDTTRNFVSKITYAGRGAYYIAASRIYDDTTYSNDLSQGELFNTLQDVLNSVSSINVNSTTTGAPGTDAIVTIDGTSLDFVIPRGMPFIIAAEYLSVADLSSATPNVIPTNYEPELFDLVIINTGSVEDEENAQLFIYDGEGPEGGFTFISDLSGATGPTRLIEWKSDSTEDPADNFIIRWANSNNSDWDTSSEKDLSLTPSWDGTELTIARSDGTEASYDLGITPSWNGTELTLSPNDGGIDASYDLGITPSFSGSTLILSPNDGSPDATYDIGVTLSQDGSEIIFTPNETGDTISYDIGFIPSFDANGRLTITPNDSTLTPIFYDLGWSASFTNTTLTLTPDNGDPTISVDLGITPSWDANGTLTITPNEVGSPVSYDLGWEASFNNTTLTFAPDAQGVQPISVDLGVTPTWDGSELTIAPNYSEEATGVSADLGLNYTWGGEGLSDTTLTIQDKVGGSGISQELGTYAEWGDGIEETLTSLRFQNGDGTYTDYQELGLEASWTGTELTITTPNEVLDPVDLKADSPTITASANSIAYTESAAVTVTEPTPNTFNLEFDIPIGEPLTINVTYSSVSDMTNNTSPTPSGYTPTLFDLAMIQSPGGVEIEENAKLFFYNSDEWIFVSDLSGAKGQTGDVGPIGPMPDHQWVGTSLQFELPGGGYGDLVDLKGDGALDSDIVNTSTLAGLDGLANQKLINEHFDTNIDAKVSKTGDTMTGDLVIGESFPHLFATDLVNSRIDTNADWYYFGVTTYLSEGDVPIVQYDSSGAIRFDSQWTMRDANFDEVVVFDYESGELSYNGEEIATTADLDTKVDKAGATMTGDLVINEADFTVLGTAGTAFSVDADLEKAYVGSHEVATVQSFVAGVKETNTQNNIQFWVGTQAQYNALGTYSNTTIYYIVGA